MHFTTSLPAIATRNSYSDYSSQEELLTDTRVYEQKLLGYHFKVSLVSRALELDQGENPVPNHTQAIDVVVAESTRAAIEQLIAVVSWLDGYTIVADWIPSNCCEF